MARKKKVDVEEVIEPMKDDAMNLPVEDVPLPSATYFKKVNCSASRVNVRDGENGNVLFTINNLSKVMIESESNGWAKITGFVMSDLLSEL